MNATFGQRLEQAIKEAGHTQASLGRAIGLTRSAINQIIQGQSKGMHPENLIKACKILQVRPEWLALGENPKHPFIRHGDLEFLADYHRLSPAQQKTVASIVNDLAANPS